MDNVKIIIALAFITAAGCSSNSRSSNSNPPTNMTAGSYTATALNTSTVLSNGEMLLVQYMLTNTSSEAVEFNRLDVDLTFTQGLVLRDPVVQVGTQAGVPGSFVTSSTTQGDVQFTNTISLAKAGQADDSVVVTVRIVVTGAGTGDSLSAVIPVDGLRGTIGTQSLPAMSTPLAGRVLTY